MPESGLGERFYRSWQAPEGMVTFQVRLEQSDLFISAETDLRSQAIRALEEARAPLKKYIERDPDFASAMEPCEIQRGAPPLVRRMARAARTCGVGPMAAVAGAIAEDVGRNLLYLSRQIVVENGGDVFALLERPLDLCLYAGPDKPSVPLELPPSPEGAGIATSSAGIGPSISLGAADAAMVAADNAALADACATALANRIKSPRDLRPALEWAVSVKGVNAAAAVCENQTALLGKTLKIGNR